MNPGPISANSVSQMSSLEHYLFEPRSAPYLASLLLLSRHLSPADSISRLSYHPWLSARFTQQKAQATYQKAGRMASFFPPQASPLFCAFLPLWFHLSPGCPTLQGSSSSWAAFIYGLGNHPSSALHQPIFRCSSCLLCYLLPRCLT